MPASITLQNLSCSTPDGRPLFSHLDLSFGPVRTGVVGRNGVGKSTLLRLISGELAPSAGSIAVSGTIAVLDQLVQVGPEVTIAGLLGAEEAVARLGRLEAGSGTLDDAAEADWTLPARMAAAFAEVGLPDLDPARLAASLSGGQRTRAALAGLIVRAPDMVLLDEPTNNLDAEGRDAVARLLAVWRGGAVVISHDRTLLRQMDAILELTTLGARLYGGNWDFYRERKSLELSSAEHDLARAERQVAEIARRNQAEAERQAHRAATGSRRAARGGVPRIVAGGMKRQAETTAAGAQRLGNRLSQQAAGEAAEARARVEVLEPINVALPSSRLHAGRKVLQAAHLTGGPVIAAPIIRDLSFEIEGPERIAITGPNGSGKTTLLRLLSGALAPLAGTAEVYVPFAMLDQTVSLLDPAETIRDNYRRLNPSDDENACRAALARFKFRADAALQVVGTLSGGELLRAGLAVTIGASRPPQLLILDEPTNHLDFDAIEAVEAGLSAYDGALLVVSHDRDFLAAIGVEREVVPGG